MEKGGRLTAPEDSYQQLPRETRLRMTINGVVCEEMAVAPHILHACHHVPFEVFEEHDPYEIPGLS
jgi:hypothetical protein